MRLYPASSTREKSHSSCLRESGGRRPGAISIAWGSRSRTWSLYTEPTPATGCIHVFDNGALQSLAG